jgi:signal transduction histidine kinase
MAPAGTHRPGWLRGPSTFGGRIVWFIVPLVLGLLLLHAGLTVREHRRLVLGEFLKRGQELAHSLAYRSELGVFTEDRRLLESSLRVAAGDPDVAYVVIYSSAGALLAASPPPEGGAALALAPEDQARLAAQNKGFSRTLTGRTRVAEFFAPIVSEETIPTETLLGALPERGPEGRGRQRMIGVARLGLSLRSVDAHVLTLLKYWGGVTLVFSALSALAVYASARRITRPIARLTEHAGRIATGDLSRVIPVESGDEIGKLAAAFNEMTRSLKSHIDERERILAELQELNRTLEERIRERTAELQQRTEALQRSLEDVRALAGVSRAVSSSLQLQEVLDTVAAYAARLSRSDGCGIFEFNRDRRAFDVVASCNLRPAFLDAIRQTPFDPRQGVIGQAVERGQPFQLTDVAAAVDYPLRDLMLNEPLRAQLAVPMGDERNTRGIVLFRREPGPFDDRVVALLTALANQSRVAIDNARLFQEVQAQRVQLEQLSKNMEQLYRLSTAMQEPVSLKEQLTRVLDGARQAVFVDRFYLWVLSPQGDRVTALAGAGFSEEEGKDFVGAEIVLSEAGAMYRAYRDGRPLLFDDQHPLPPELRLKPPYANLRGLRSRSFLVIPMLARGRTVGLLTADNKPSRRPIPPQTVDLLQIFASHAAGAIENARLFQEIEEKSHQLEIASQHKSQFLANMSHELRTPLNAILGYAELILDNIYGEVTDRLRDVLQRVHSSGRHLLGLINDVLDLSKIEAGRLALSLDDYSMEEVVRAAHTAVGALAVQKRLPVIVSLAPGLPRGRGDERRLTQVVLNLLSNAIKFTETGEIRLTAAGSNGRFTVSVSDTGPGIAAADHQKIFGEFHQGDASSTRRKGGTGLGLTIAKKIVELHGGRIWVESSPGRGSTFSFTVPERVERQTGDT